MEDKLQQLLKNKRFEDLSSQERKYVRGMVTHEEYQTMQLFLRQKEMVLDKIQKGIAPNPEIYNHVRIAFQEKYGSHAKSHFPSMGKKRPGYWPRRKLAYALAVGLFLILMSSLLFHSSENAPVSTTAMDIGKIENFAEMNQYMYLDTTCLDVEPILVPDIE